MTTTITYNLAPTPRWLFTDLTGKILSDGVMYTYRDLNRVIEKAVFQDPEGMIPWANPVPFEINGMPDGALYWASDENYYLAVFDRLDVPQFTVSEYNAPFVNDINPAPVFVSNLVRNAQFTWWTNSATYPSISESQNNWDYIADDWLFERNNLNATINISQEIFNLGQNDVPSNPFSYLHYECTNAGAGGETTKNIYQVYDSVKTLADQEVSIAFWARSPSVSQIDITFEQFFGSGGSPSSSVSTAVLTPTLTTTWQQYVATITIPDVDGKTLGTDGDDALYFNFGLPLNSIAEIDLDNVQIQTGSEISTFPYVTFNEQYKLLDKTFNGLFFTGDFKVTLNPAAHAGWAVCNDGTIGDQASGASFAALYTKALFILLWNSIANSYAPIFNSDGTVSTRGVNAEADYNAHKRLALTKTVGRILATAGEAVLTQTFTADPTNDRLTMANATSFYNGTPVTVSSTATLAAPLVAATLYYVVSVNSTQIALATTLANALANIYINLTTPGTGIQTVAIDYSNFDWAPGQYIGEFSHATTIAELPSHDHDYIYPEEVTGRTDGGDTLWQAASNTTLETGGNEAHNNIQPTTFLYTHIKF